jgi:hypothetical protein
MTSKLFKVMNFNLPSPCPLSAPNPVRFLASICWEREVLLQEAVPKERKRNLVLERKGD